MTKEQTDILFEAMCKVDGGCVYCAQTIGDALARAFELVPWRERLAAYLEEHPGTYWGVDDVFPMKDAASG